MRERCGTKIGSREPIDDDFEGRIDSWEPIHDLLVFFSPFATRPAAATPATLTWIDIFVVRSKIFNLMSYKHYDQACVCVLVISMVHDRDRRPMSKIFDVRRVIWRGKFIKKEKN